MAGRSAKVTQAELERALRAARAAGYSVVRIVTRADGYSIETAPSLAPDDETVMTKPRRPVL
jgi:hypothetical protein